MSDLDRFYLSVGTTSEEVVGRLGGNESMVRRFLKRFSEDRSFEELSIALNANDVDSSFRFAHTLKGVAANLGIETLFKEASAVTELLRAKKLEEAKIAFPSLEKEYRRVCSLLEDLG